jgi:hypothetical protein
LNSRVGLKSAPSTFQLMMNTVLIELIGERCLVYMDDILVIGETLNEHNLKLRAVFQKLKEYNLKIKPDKCKFLKEVWEQSTWTTIDKHQYPGNNYLISYPW